MKRGMLSFSDIRRLRQSPIFAFLAAALFCGVLAGSFTGMHIPQSEGKYVSDLAALVSSNAAGQMPSWKTVVTCFGITFVWAVGAVIVGAFPGRMLWVALLMSLRGFFLAFAAAAAVVESGWWGVYISVVSIGISAVLWIPAMLILGTAVLDAGMGRKKYGYFASLGQYGGVLMICLFLLVGAALWRLLAVPVLLGIVG